MDGIDAYVLAKNIAISAVSGVKNYTVDGTTLKIETNDGNVLDMVFPVPTGIESGYYNDENSKFYRDSEFENEIIGKTDVVYIDHGQNRLCFWNGTEFTTTKKNALEFTAEEKAKLERLRNYDDSVLSGKINNIEKVIPSNASASNKLATIADVENKNDGTTNYNDLENKPKIAGIELSGNKSLTDLGIQPAIAGKGLSTEDFTTEEKTKLSSLSNYNDSSIKGELANIKNVIPSNANSENKLATLADIPSGGSGNEGGTTNYSELTNKPQIAGVTLSGNKTLNDLGIQGAEEGKGLSTNDFSNEDKVKLDNLSNYDDTSLKGRMSNIENKIPSKASSSNKLATMADIPSVPEIPEVITDYSDLSNKPQIGGVTLDGNKNLADLGIQATEEGKGLSTEDFTTEEKNKLAELVNYNDSELNTRVSSIEEVMPTSATPSNPLATLADIPSNVSGGSSTPTNYATLSNKPQIAGVELTGNKTLANLGIQPSEEGKGLSTNDFSDEEKTKLAGLVNYDDTALSERVTNIENVIPPTLSEENKLATLADIPEVDNVDYNALANLVNNDSDTSYSIEVGETYILGEGIKTNTNNNVQAKCLSIDNGIAVMQTYGITSGTWDENDNTTYYKNNHLKGLSDAISEVNLPTGTSSSDISPNGAYDILTNAAAHYTNFNANYNLAWLRTSSNGEGAYAVQSDGQVLDGRNKRLAMVWAPYFKLDLTKVINNEGVIELDTPKELNATDMINKIEKKLNNRYIKSEVDTALNNKVDKVENKGLSTNDYTTEEKEKLAGLSNYDDTSLSGRVTTVENTLSDKVNKVEGKGLSTNDYTDEEKTKLAGLSNYDDTEINSRVQGLENIIPENVSNENKLATIKDINDIPIITSSDIDRLWGITFGDGDEEEY